MSADPAPRTALLSKSLARKVNLGRGHYVRRSQVIAYGAADGVLGTRLAREAQAAGTLSDLAAPRPVRSVVVLRHGLVALCAADSDSLRRQLAGGDA